MTGLQVSDLVKSWDGRLIVDHVDLAIDDGEFFVVLGPSGCGKTTLLRMICGLERPDAGAIFIRGRSVVQLPPRERNVGMVFQEYGLYPSMDVYGNLAYGLQARGKVAKQEIDRRVRDAAAELGLTPLLSGPITDLSGGEQQRIALGRAMVSDADAYLFDEPLSNLDPQLRHRIRREITSIHRAKRKPTLYVTHDQAEAFAMGDRIAVMADGRLQQVGTAAELIDSPATLFVAGFVGSPPMNLLPCDLIGHDGDYVARCGTRTSFRLAPIWKRALARYDKPRVMVGIRPDAWVLSATESDNSITGQIVDVEPLIGESVVRARTDDGQNLAAVISDESGKGFAAGQTVHLAVAGDMCLFDRDTEQALAP